MPRGIQRISARLMTNSDVVSHRDRCAIVGIGSTDYSSASGRSELTLATQAAIAAVEDAGMAVTEIDGIVRCDKDVVTAIDLVESLGLSELTYWSDGGPGGAAPAALVGQAVGAILSGQATTVLVFRSSNGRSARGRGVTPRWRTPVGGGGTYDEYFVPYGLFTPGQVFALVARRHMIEYGITSDHLGRVALACRARANANPFAQMHGRPLTMDEYLAGRVLASPLRLFDYCLETDGASAVIVTAADRARHFRKPVVLIRGLAQGSLSGPQPGPLFPELLRESSGQHAEATAKTLYSRAGIGPADVDVAQIYDCFTIAVLTQLESYGFCAIGEAGPFVAGGGIDLDGPLPINTSGGLLGEANIHGMNHVLEGVRQIRGESYSQVPRAEVCLVTSTALRPGSAMVLRSE
jgi:acetyl-CoA acetyltransferase